MNKKYKQQNEQNINQLSFLMMVKINKVITQINRVVKNTQKLQLNPTFWSIHVYSIQTELKSCPLILALQSNHLKVNDIK